MKKILLIITLLAITMIGCQNKNEPITESTERSILDMSFEERTKEARTFMNQDNGYGIQHYVENASLEKNDSHYIMKLQFVSPVIYDKEEIQKAYELAQENGSYNFYNYTFYKDNEIPVNEKNKFMVESIYEDQEYFQEDFYNATIDGREDLIFTFRRTPNNNDKYYIYCKNEPSDGYTVFEPEKEIEVLLKPEDKMTITFDRDSTNEFGKELSVEDYYQKAINNEVSSEEFIKGFEYSLSAVGNSYQAWENTNAINFDNGYININYHKGGI